MKLKFTMLFYFERRNPITSFSSLFQFLLITMSQKDGVTKPILTHQDTIDKSAKKRERE